MPRSAPALTVVPASAPLTAADHKRLGAELTALYLDAVEGHMRVLGFGSRLIEVEGFIATRGDKPSRKGGRPEGGLASWLRDYAPEVTYTTARRFRNIAAGVAEKFGLKDPAKLFATPVAKLAAPDRVKRDKVSAFMADRSLRQVQLELGLTEPRKDTDPTTGKRQHHPQRRSDAELREEWVKAARIRATDTFADLHTLDDRWKLLPDAQLKVALSDLGTLYDALKGWLSTPEPARVALEIERHLQEASA